MDPLRHDLTKKSSAIVLALAFFGGCREEQPATVEIGKGISATLDTEFLSAEIEKHPFLLSLQKEFELRGVSSPEELAVSQSRALLALCRSRGDDYEQLLYAASENLFGLNCDLAQLRQHLAILNDENSELWQNKIWVRNFLRSAFGGNLNVMPVVSGDRVDLNIDYQIRPWEHPKAAFYFLTVKVRAITEGEDPLYFENSVTVTPDPYITSNVFSKYPVPLPARGKKLDVEVSLSFEAVEDRANTWQFTSEPELHSNIGFVRNGATNDKREEVLSPDLTNLSAAANALLNGFSSAANWADWQRKVALSPDAIEFNQEWMGKEFPQLTFQTHPGIQNNWQPESDSKMFKGPALIEFFQMSCGPCIEDMPHLKATADEINGLSLVALCNPRDVDGIENLRNTPPLAVPTIESWDKIQKISTFPRKMLLDQNGIVRWTSISNAMPSKSLVQKVIKEVSAQ